MSKKKKSSWVVRMKVERTVEIVCENCTEDQARSDPYEHAIGEETEIEQYSYAVVSVEPNE